MNEQEKSERILTVVLCFVFSIPFIFAVFLGGLKIFVIIIFSLLFTCLSYFLPNFIFFKKCKKSLGSQGGVILSHNRIYSKWAFSLNNTKIDVYVNRGGKWQPTNISFTADLENNKTYEFNIVPDRSIVKANRIFDEINGITSSNKLILDNKFQLGQNTIPVETIEQILAPVKADLLKNIKKWPWLQANKNNFIFNINDNFLTVAKFNIYLNICRTIINNLIGARVE